jgi:hypothetical protein
LKLQILHFLVLGKPSGTTILFSWRFKFFTSWFWESQVAPSCFLEASILHFLVLGKPSVTILFSWSFKFITSFAEFSKVTWLLWFWPMLCGLCLLYCPSLHFHTMQQFQTVFCWLKTHNSELSAPPCIER